MSVVFLSGKSKSGTTYMNHLSFIGTCMNTLPRENLGPQRTSAENEAHFVSAFVTAYDAKYSWLHSGSSKLNRIMAREVPVNGFGIADLVTVSWDISLTLGITDNMTAELRPTVRAFEFKLSDWRRGMMQAHRYRFFADVAILVIPAKVVSIAEVFLDTFRTLNIGLWGFSQETGSISMVSTPRPRHPSDDVPRDRAISKVLDTAKQGLPFP